MARAVKAELPDWTVLYFDEYRAFFDPDRPAEKKGERSYFEWEIEA